MKQAQWEMKTKVGTFYLVASENGLQGLFWKKQDVPFVNSLISTDKKIKILASAVAQLEEYFTGGRKEFHLPLDVTGTKFQRSVWAQLSKIPYGKTCSYLDIATALKNKNAVRALGAANGRNPLSIIVPCHRVIAANGALTGYAGGLPTKTKLLALESSRVAPGDV